MLNTSTRAIDMASKTCPNCGLYSVESALACDCGYRYASLAEPMAASPAVAKQPMPRYPWLTIWYKPRGTIRAIVDNNPSYGFFLLASILGVLTALGQAIREGYGDSIHWTAITIGALVLGPLIGILALYIGAAILWVVGDWLGGYAEIEEVRSVLAWSSIPNILHSAIVIIFAVITTGPELFRSEPARLLYMLERSAPLALLYLSAAGLLLVVMLILNTWQIFILIKGLSEVHHYSVWRAIVTLAIPIVPIAGLALCALMV